MTNLPREVVTLLSHGVTYRRDVIEIIGRTRYDELLRTGLGERRPGRLVAFRGLTDHWTPLVETQLRCPKAVACRRLACWLHQAPPYSGPRPPAQDWISPRGSHIPAVRRVDRLDPSDVVQIGGLWVTSPLRTLIDVGAVDEDLLERVGERFLHRGDVTEAEIMRYLEAATCRVGVPAVRDFIARRGPGAAPCESDLEVRFLQIARGLGYPEPTHRQFPVRRDDGGRYRVDFVWVVGRRMVFVEVDGDGAHSDPLARRYDTTRQNVVLRSRPALLRFTEAHVNEDHAHIDREMSLCIPRRRTRRAS